MEPRNAIVTGVEQVDGGARLRPSVRLSQPVAVRDLPRQARR
jgi:hypothetical protein